MQIFIKFLNVIIFFKIELVSSKEAGIYQALNQINEIYGSKLEIKEMSDVKTILDRGEGRLKW